MEIPRGSFRAAATTPALAASSQSRIYSRDLRNVTQLQRYLAPACYNPGLCSSV